MCSSDLGFTSASAHRDEWVARLHPDDREATREHIRAAMRDETPEGRYTHRYRVVDDDGTVRWLSGSGRVRFAGEGTERRAIDMTGTVQDITDSMLIEQALRDSERSLEAAQALAHVGSWDYDIVEDSVRYSDERSEGTRLNSSH